MVGTERYWGVTGSIFPPFLSLRRRQNRQRRKTRRIASEAPTTLIEIAKSRTTVDESPEEDEDAVPVAPVLVLVCVVGESRTSKLSHSIQSVFFFFISRKITDNSHEHINNSILATVWDGYMNRMLLIRSTGPRCNYLWSYGCVSARWSRWYWMIHHICQQRWVSIDPIVGGNCVRP